LQPVRPGPLRGGPATMGGRGRRLRRGPPPRGPHRPGAGAVHRGTLPAAGPGGLPGARRPRRRRLAALGGAAGPPAARPPARPAPPDPDERRRERELTDRLDQIDRRVTALLGAPEVPEAARAAAEELRRERDGLEAELTQLEATVAARGGVPAGQVYDLRRVQERLPADAALVGWLDVPAPPRAADPRGEH